MFGFEKYKGENKVKRQQRKKKEPINKAPGQGDEKKKKKKMRRSLGIVGIMLLAVLAALVALVLIVFSRLTFIDKSDQAEIDPANEWFETYDGEITDEDVLSAADVQWYKSGETIYDKAVTNILLIGQDRREGEGRTRSDTMIIVSINRATDEITLVSLMRDMYVQIPGYSDNKMNAAYAFGGMELIDRTITRNFGIIIDGNIEVDFTAFKEVVALLGGIDINMTAHEAEMMQIFGAGTFKEGMNHLDSEQALMYVQNREMEGYDYSRTDRQRKLLTAVYDSLKKQEVSNVIAVADKVMGHVTTDINLSKMTNYIVSVAKDFKKTTIASYRIPVDGTFYDAYVEGMAVLVPDLEWNRIYLKNYLYGLPLRAADNDHLKILKRLKVVCPYVNDEHRYFRCTIDMKAYGVL